MLNWNKDAAIYRSLTQKTNKTTDFKNISTITNTELIEIIAQEQKVFMTSSPVILCLYKLFSRISGNIKYNSIRNFML